MIHILLLGKNGQVGWELQRTLAPLGEVISMGRSELDLTNFSRIREVVREIKPSLIVNAAAYTDVDRAEREPDLAMAVNGIAPGIIAEEALRLNAGLIHFSTDYVFDGTKMAPYSEDDTPNPLNTYGETKLAGERAIETVDGSCLILRTSWVYGARGKNFFRKIIRLAREREVIEVVNDQIGAPTWSRSIAEITHLIILKLMGKSKDNLLELMRIHQGIYHYCSSGQVSWFEFAEVLLATGPKYEQQLVSRLIPIHSNDYPAEADRPHYSVLATEKLKIEFGIEAPSWQAQLKACWASTDIMLLG